MSPPKRGPHRRDVAGLPRLLRPKAVYAAGHLEAEAHERWAPQQDVARRVRLLSAEGAEPTSTCGIPALVTLHSTIDGWSRPQDLSQHFYRHCDGVRGGGGGSSSVRTGTCSGRRTTGQRSPRVRDGSGGVTTAPVSVRLSRRASSPSG